MIRLLNIPPPPSPQHPPVNSLLSWAQCFLVGRSEPGNLKTLMLYIFYIPIIIPRELAVGTTTKAETFFQWHRLHRFCDMRRRSWHTHLKHLNHILFVSAVLTVLLSGQRFLISNMVDFVLFLVWFMYDFSLPAHSGSVNAGLLPGAHPLNMFAKCLRAQCDGIKHVLRVYANG